MILIKSKREIDLMRDAGQRMAAVVQELKSSLKVGQTTLEIDRLAEALMERQGAQPAFKGYRGFPGAICASLNDEVVHGIPGSRKIKQGDILSVDVGLIFEGWFADAAFTVIFDPVPDDVRRLVEVTEKALAKGIEQARVGNHLSDIGFAIQSFVEPFGFSIVRDFVGHGIGRDLHEEPEVPNYGLPKTGPVLEDGMTLAIEPMVNLGDFRTKVLDDKWTVVTWDGKPSAHFEHTVAITNEGPRILTQ